jgi:hypothetical protein
VGCSDFGMVINFTVEDDGIAVAQMHGLFAAADIENGKPEVKKIDIVDGIAVLLVGAPMVHQTVYLRIGQLELDRSGNAAHTQRVYTGKLT